MNPEPEDRKLLDLAMRIADGAPVDWSDPATSEATLGGITEDLRALEAMAARAFEPGTDRAAPGDARSAPRVTGFTIERELGSGGAGVVYLARDVRLERTVAIKVLPREVALDPARLARIER